MDDDTAGTERQIEGDAGGKAREEHRVSGDRVISKIKELITLAERRSPVSESVRSGVPIEFTLAKAC